MAWDDGLTDEQKKAASHVGKHARLLAGPGTGKTLCLTRRVLYLVEEKGIQPSTILVLTFTRVAAAELRKRVESVLGKGRTLPRISTLHSFALTTILRHSTRTRLPQPIRIADDYEERWIIHEELKRILGLKRVENVSGLFDQLSANWERLAPDWEKRFPDPNFLGAWREHRGIYGYTLRSELVYQLYQSIVEGELEVESAGHLLVDEYQDLNACDLGVIEEITRRGAELFCAGDDDQSIYGFRYAEPDGIRQFDHKYKPCKLLELIECKRCDQRILDLAHYVAEQDPRRIKKRLQTTGHPGAGEVRILGFQDEDQEATAIAEICEWLICEENVAPEEILILFRSDRHSCFSKPISEALRRQGLRVAVVANPLEPMNCPEIDGGSRQVEGRIFLCLLRLIVNPQDHLAWRTMLGLGSNRIGEKTLAALYELARKQGETFHGVLEKVASDPDVLPPFGNTVKIEVERIKAVIAAEEPDSAPDLMTYVRDLSARHIRQPKTREAVCNVFERVLEATQVTDLETLLRAINISIGEKEQEREKGAINLMTMHQAKGLDADAVFVVAAEEEYLPGRAHGVAADDERRLLYVSITRARHYLFLTHCRRRTGAQQHAGSRPGDPHRRLSPFLTGGPVRSEGGEKYIRLLATKGLAW
ncbi:MAG: ATP-dependent helicase [Anaerolineae bacterium]|nr:ATP-dependent helicase [Anaerolineae bacterium]